MCTILTLLSRIDLVLFAFFVFVSLCFCFVVLLSGRCYGHVYTVVGGCFLRRDIDQMVPQWPLRLCGYLVQSRASVGNQNLDWRTMVHISLWCFVFYSFHQHGFTYFVVVSFEHFLFHGCVVLVFLVIVLLLFLLLLSNRTIPTGPCQSACWNPQGTLLLAAVAGCSDIWTFGESGLCF